MNLFQILDRFNYSAITDAAALVAKVMKESEHLLASREAAIMTFEERGRKAPTALEESVALFATILAHPEEIQEWAVEQALANRQADPAFRVRMALAAKRNCRGEVRKNPHQVERSLSDLAHRNGFRGKRAA